ncbi:hypothetical protein HMPREF0673_00172 [Leyella stercorea DSM 18206]|uniref:Uncharacterized protein n=1 Tax=Leyella stercorea DSM 18206 TaxID=1002367 RepID=G6AU88_9BACT|nr:hypothetical protein HMPREF0673_00172 [Leyella stercorea DSM 18206]
MGTISIGKILMKRSLLFQLSHTFTQLRFIGRKKNCIDDSEIEVGHLLGIRAKAVFNRHFHVFDIYGTSIMSSMRPYKTERNEVLSTA